MSRDRDQMVEMLARTVLGQLETNRSGVTAEVATGHVVVNLELESMVRRIRQQIWVDQAAIAKMATSRLEEAVSEVNLAKLVADAVNAEVASVRADIVRLVRKRVQECVDDEVRSWVSASRVHEVIRGVLGDIVTEAVRRPRDEGERT